MLVSTSKIVKCKFLINNKTNLNGNLFIIILINLNIVIIKIN